MSPWKLAAAIPLLCALSLASCARDDPEAALQAAAERLQASLESKQTSVLMELLHADFQAQRQYDRDWARRTAALMFLRHRNVKVIALTQRSWIDPTYPDRGHTEAQLALTGAEALIPQRAGHYQVRLQWRREGNDWQLAQLDWD
ncbi:hypothetical protein CXK94_01380 [Stutzerimonas stutzeri]|uniref:DUF4440 domain-containing protein n=1 Tax=Stutzerimonas stutzeri TaxID=316 RepID=A0A2N8T936_STUST|nr:hypothetical protein [Stutzerimonas stutzeri]MCQ4325148.1 hypothetical protein [Stutzerimonas stutzeri]PNG11258.1 hypothetical protein CXK94_01380 [Stutzerimonas stutzeri]